VDSASRPAGAKTGRTVMDRDDRRKRSRAAILVLSVVDGAKHKKTNVPGYRAICIPLDVSSGKAKVFALSFGA